MYHTSNIENFDPRGLWGCQRLPTFLGGAASPTKPVVTPNWGKDEEPNQLAGRKPGHAEALTSGFRAIRSSAAACGCVAQHAPLEGWRAKGIGPLVGPSEGARRFCRIRD